MNSDLTTFIAVAGLATILWSIAAILLNCRRLIRGDWADSSLSVLVDRPLPEWMRWLAGSVPQLTAELDRIRRDLRRAALTHRTRSNALSPSATVSSGAVYSVSHCSC